MESAQKQQCKIVQKVEIRANSKILIENNANGCVKQMQRKRSREKHEEVLL